MKAIVLSVAVLVCAVGYTQPVITADVLPEVAESFSLTPFDATGFDPGDTGAGVTWNFSDLDASGSVETTVAHDASTIGGHEDFPEANVAWTNDGLTFTFFKSNSSVLENWGSVVNDADLGFISIPYSDGEELLTLPLNFGDTNEDDFDGAFSAGGFDVARTGTTTMHADAYGTLITPAGTLYNVLRVKVVEDYSDEIILLGLSTVYHFEQYYWFLNGNTGPVFQYVYAYVDALGTITEQEVGYYNADVVGIRDIPSLNISVYPNPASDHVLIDLPGMQGTVQVTINDLAGNLVWETSVQTDGNVTVTPGQLPAGQYLLQVEQDGAFGAAWISWQ